MSPLGRSLAASSRRRTSWLFTKVCAYRRHSQRSAAVKGGPRTPAAAAFRELDDVQLRHLGVRAFLLVVVGEDGPLVPAPRHELVEHAFDAPSEVQPRVVER